MKFFYLFCLVCLFSFSNAEKVYDFYLDIYKNDSVELLGFEISNREIEIPSSYFGEIYEFRIVSKDGNSLYNKTFKIDFNVYLKRVANSSLPDVIPVEKITRNFYLPYYENAQKIELFHNEKKIFEYKVSKDSEIKISKKQDNNINLILTAIVLLFVIAGIRFWLSKKRGAK